MEIYSSRPVSVVCNSAIAAAQTIVFKSVKLGSALDYLITVIARYLINIHLNNYPLI